MQSPLLGGATVGLVGDAAYLAHAHALCAAARERLWVTQFVIDGRMSSDVEGLVIGLCHELALAHHRGVDVRVVHDDLRTSVAAPELNAAFRRFLASRGVPVRVHGGFDDERLGRGPRKRRTQRRRYSLHAKMLLCHGSSALVGNHNWTGGAFREHREMSLSISSPDALHWLGNYFETIWERAEVRP